MGCTPEEQATYDAFFGDTGGPIFPADLVDKAISNDAPNFDGMIRVDGSQASIASTIFLATEQRHRAHNEDVERLIWQPVPDKPMTGIISQMVAAHEETLQRYAKQTTGVIGRIDLSTHEEYTSLKVKEGMYREVAKGWRLADGEDGTAERRQPPKLELEDIMHIRGSVSHFMGHPVPTWEDVDRIESECRKLSNVIGVPFHEACSIAADLFAKAVPDQYSPNKIKVVLKELANQAQFAKEKTIFNCRISARQARRSAQGVKFAKQLKNNFNVKKGK